MAKVWLVSSATIVIFVSLDSSKLEFIRKKIVNRRFLLKIEKNGRAELAMVLSHDIFRVRRHLLRQRIEAGVSR